MVLPLALLAAFAAAAQPEADPGRRFFDGAGLLPPAPVESASDEPVGKAGPLPKVDYNPSHSPFLNLAPEGSRVLSRGRSSISMTVTRTNSMEGWAPCSQGGAGALHAETTRFYLDNRIGLGRDLELQVGVPMLQRDHPTMDGFIGWVEKGWMGRMMPARTRFQGSPAFYEYALPDGRHVHSAPGDWGLGDTSITLKRRLLKEGEGPGVALRAGFELPTGSPRHGYGSGSTDAAIGLSLDKKLLPWLIAYVNLTGTLPIGAPSYVRPFGAASLAFEALATESLSIVLQSDSYTSPLQNTGVGFMDGRDDVVTLGARYSARVGGQVVRVGAFFGENFNYPWPGARWAGSADDFTVGATFAVEPP